TAAGGGGGVYSTNFASITDSLISSNIAQTDAGGGIQINAEGWTVDILNSTLTDNTGSGGAISVRQGDVLLGHSTVAYNTYNGVGGGGIENQSLYGSTIRLEDTIIAFNNPVNCTGDIINNFGNIQYPGPTCGGGITIHDPQLGELSGLPTSFLLPEGSTAGS